MAGKGLWSGVKNYGGMLVATIIFPILWMQSLRLAGRHVEADPRGRLKVLAAIAIGTGILAVGAFTLINFREDALWRVEHTVEEGQPVEKELGIYHSLDVRVAGAIGETEYQDNVAIVATKPTSITTSETKLAEAQEEGDADKVADYEAAIALAKKELADAQAKVALLTPNHQLYDAQLKPAILAQDDDAIRAAAAGSNLAYPKDISANVDAALANKNESVSDMDMMLTYFIWPSLIGAFFAPLAFALGSILRKSFVASDTVGFKPYPGTAAGFFLLFGAFGVPSIPYAAWVFLDAKQRSIEGQIAL